MQTSSTRRHIRVGTWNLAGRWGADHQTLLEEGACDVWLLTEVNERVRVPGFSLHMGDQSMAPGRRWAGVLSRLEMSPLPDPHAASAMAEVVGVRFCSSVLPWRSCGNGETWVGDRHSLKTAAAVQDLVPLLREASGPVVWGGDWNHALAGREYAGSIAGRASILTALNELQLRPLTADLPHRIDGLLTIDHLACGPGIAYRPAERVVAEADGLRLSDHDAYVVDLEITRPS